MAKDFITSGFLDVKISAKVKRGFIPWKAWKKQWCEIKRLGTIDHGLEIKLRNSTESNSFNCFNIPRNALICRTESRSKQFSFGVFSSGRQHKPLVFLSGISESDSQLWMYSIRRMLSFATHIPAPQDGYYVSLVDNAHSRAAQLNGINGVLTTNALEVVITNPVTNEVQTCLQWHQLLQFHLAATNSSQDEGKICVMHTSNDFRAGAGQLYFYCAEAPQLLELLVTRGKNPRIYVNSAMVSRRFSRSEGDLRDEKSINGLSESPTSPIHLRSQSGSEDSGVRVSMASDDSNLMIKCKKAASLLSIGLGLLMATPGGSEADNESMNELLDNEEIPISTYSQSPTRNSTEARRESGVSLLSGVYEEIPDLPPTPKDFQDRGRGASTHHYEDPVDLILGTQEEPGLCLPPPPLPPRQDTLRKFSFSTTSAYECENMISLSPPDSPDHLVKNFKSHLFIQGESEYMDMTHSTPSKIQTENIYTPMCASIIEENTYMVMRGD